MKSSVLIFFLLLAFRLNAQIIADHTVVDKYADIPQQYIDSVKKMWVQVLGESHSGAYRYGINLLAKIDSRFSGKGMENVLSSTGKPDGPTNDYLRLSRVWWLDIPTTAEGPIWTRSEGGEEDFWTTTWAVNNVKTNIDYCNNPQGGNNPVAAVGFGWCWDMATGIGGTTDPEFGTRWGGRSYYWNGTAFSNAGAWGLNAADKVHTNNNICLDNYLNAIVEIGRVDPKTLCFFSTGPVDISGDGAQNESESGYQRHLKHEYIRNFAKNNDGYIFDFADILSYNDAGEQKTASWNGKSYQIIHPDNDGEYNGGSGSCHLSEAGCIRLAKAMWWMLAKYAGWENSTSAASIDNHQTLKVYPLPTKDHITIESSSAIEEIILYDIRGLKISAFSNQSKTLDVSGLNKGVYLLKIKVKNSYITKKVILE